MKLVVIATVLALGVSAPAFAHTAPKPPAPQAVDVTQVADPAGPIEAVDETAPLDTQIELATTPEARLALIKRCAGPPPRPPAHVAEAQPADTQSAAEKGYNAALQAVANLTRAE